MLAHCAFFSLLFDAKIIISSVVSMALPGPIVANITTKRSFAFASVPLVVEFLSHSHSHSLTAPFYTFLARHPIHEDQWN